MHIRKYWIASLLLSFSCFGQSKDLTIVTEIFPPFSYVENGKMVGVATNRVKRILEKTSIEYQINAYPWARSFHLAQTEPNTLIYPIYKTQEREPLFHWFCPIYPPTPVYLFGLKASDTSQMRDISSLRDKVVGVTRHDNSHTYLEELGFIDKFNLDVVGEPLDNLRNLVAGRIDAIVQTEASLQYRANRLGLSMDLFERLFELHPEQRNEPCMALNKQTNPELVSELRTAFENWGRTQSL